LREGPLRKMNEKVHRQTDGEVMFNTEWTFTNQDDLEKIHHEDPTIGTPTTIKINNHNMKKLSKRHLRIETERRHG
jgi:hypothetical protein